MKKLLVLLSLFIIMSPFSAAAQQWRIDSAHTNFYFEVNHTYVPVRGQFMEFSGDVVFDPANPAAARFEFSIKVDSVDTRIGKRDTHLRSPDFFDSGKYPEITFRSDRVVHGGDNRYNVEGILTIKDVSRKVALEFVYLGQRDNPLNPEEIVAGLETRYTLDRLEYNVGDGRFYKMGVVDRDVDILFVLELLRDK